MHYKSSFECIVVPITSLTMNTIRPTSNDANHDSGGVPAKRAKIDHGSKGAVAEKTTANPPSFFPPTASGAGDSDGKPKDFTPPRSSNESTHDNSAKSRKMEVMDILKQQKALLSGDKKTRTHPPSTGISHPVATILEPTALFINKNNNNDNSKKTSLEEDTVVPNEEATGEAAELEAFNMSQSERKRYREKTRRQNISSAIDQLTKVLLKVDPTNFMSHNNQVYFAASQSQQNDPTFRKRRSSAAPRGSISTSHHQPLNRTEVINHAVLLIERLANESEQIQMELMHLQNISNSDVNSKGNDGLAGMNMMSSIALQQVCCPLSFFSSLSL